MAEADELCEKAGSARIKLEALKTRSRQSLFFSDSTEKGLIKALFNQGGHRAAMECEAGFVEKIIRLGNRFNIDILLEAYNQKDYECDIDGKQNSLIKPCLNLLYCVQPVLASKFFWKYADDERGLAPRFIPIFPYKPIKIPTIGSSKFPAPATNDYAQQFQFFSETVKSILRENFTQDLRREIHTLNITPDAIASLENFQQHNLSLIQNGYGHLAAFLKKLHGKACRIAAVLHLWDCYVNGDVTYTINEQSVAAGIDIAKALISHASHAFSPAGLVGLDPAQRIQTWIKKSHIQFFYKSILRSAIDSNVKDDLLEYGLQRLVSCNVLGEIHDHEGKPIYVVNPNLCGWFISPIAILPPAQALALPLPQPSAQALALPLPQPSAQALALPLPQPSAQALALPLPQPSAQLDDSEGLF